LVPLVAGNVNFQLQFTNDQGFTSVLNEHLQIKPGEVAHIPAFVLSDSLVGSNLGPHTVISGEPDAVHLQITANGTLLVLKAAVDPKTGLPRPGEGFTYLNPNDPSGTGSTLKDLTVNFHIGGHDEIKRNGIIVSNGG